MFRARMSRTEHITESYVSIASSTSRKALLLAGTAAVALGAAAPADAASLTLNYQCKYPLIGAQPLKIDIDAAIPSSVAAGTPTGQYAVTAKATAGGSTFGALALVGAKTIGGTSNAAATVGMPDGSRLPVTVPISIDPYAVPSSAPSGGMVLTTRGQTPSLTFSSPGTAKVSVDSIQLNLVAKDASGNAITDLSGQQVGPATDNDPATFDVYCTLSPAGQSTTLATVSVTGGAAATPVPATPAPTTPAPAAPAPATPKPVVTPAPEDPTAEYGYTMSGSAQLQTLTKGSVPVSGSIDAKLNLNTGGFNAQTVIGDSRAKLKTLGFLTVDAVIGYDGVPTGAGVYGNTVGMLNPSTGLSARTKQYIRLRSAKVFGINLVSGKSCGTKDPVTIDLASTGPFAPLKGGTIAGTFRMGSLADCGMLTGLLSPLTSGDGNAIAVALTPKR